MSEAGACATSGCGVTSRTLGVLSFVTYAMSTAYYTGSCAENGTFGVIVCVVLLVCTRADVHLNSQSLQSSTLLECAYPPSRHHWHLYFLKYSCSG